MRKALFQINDGPVYIGYTNGDLWNGWATPYFTLEEALKLQNEINRGGGARMLYDSRADKFYLQYEDEDEPYVWKGEDIQTVDGIKHLYGIGAYSHIWDELAEPDKRYLAELISDFLYDCDPYTYSDEYIEADEVIDGIIAQLEDIELFAKAHSIMNSDSLGSDEKLNELDKIFNI